MILTRKLREVRLQTEDNYRCGCIRAYLLCRVMDGRGPIYLSCARCGGRIGFYERFWWHRPNGSIIDTGYLEMRDDDRAQDPTPEYYHRTCLGPAEPLAAPVLRVVAHDEAVGAPSRAET